jgi:double-strand break repair protein MRE11
LFGGDLFNDNKPSRETLHRTIEMFRKYCCGDKPVPLRIQSDQSVNFRHNFGTVNYEDPNFNISLPVFAIHGNHDDPTGENGLSAMDLLSISNLVNYFGKSSSVDDIHVKPILITKGITKLALYGLGHIRDERLYQTFKQKKVKFYRPVAESTSNTSDWFNIFVVHQNRNQHHTKKSNISEAWLRGFFDIVVWGHEHEQKIQPTHSAEGNFEVIQPGSSIITGLVPEEAKQKKICMLEIYKDQYRFEEIDLRTVRPFVMDTIALQNFEELDDEKNNPEEIAEFLSAKVEEMIETAKTKWEEQSKGVSETSGPGKLLKQYGKALQLPLIRLKVDYSGGFASVNPQRFGQRFADRVANPADILLMTRSKQKTSSKGKGSTAGEEEESDVTTKDSLLKTLMASRNDDDDNQEFLEAASNALTSGITIEDLVGQYLKQKGLTLFNEFSLQDAVESFVKKEETHSIDDFVSKELKKRQERLWRDTKKVPLDQANKKTEDEMEEFLHKYIDEERATMELDHDQRRAGQAASKLAQGNEDDEEEEEPKKKKAKGKQKKKESDDDEMPTSPTRVKGENDDDDDEEEAPKKTTRGRGRGRGRGASTRGKTTSARGKKAATTSKSSKSKFKDLSDEEEEEEANKSEEEEKPKRATRSTSTRGKAKTTGTKRKKKDESEDDVELDEESEEEYQPEKKKRKTTTTTKKAAPKFISID